MDRLTQIKEEMIAVLETPVRNFNARGYTAEEISTIVRFAIDEAIGRFYHES
jgi:hypothetical protein